MGDPASYRILTVNSNYVYIIDNNLPTSRSVTNDAERVVGELLANWGPRRFFYKDSIGQTDELCHDGERFTDFKSGGPSNYIWPK